jgi:uncharacterized ParB-like nuclease family protein
LAKKARDEVEYQTKEMTNAKTFVAKAAEDRRIAAMAAAAKKKTTKKGKKDKDDAMPAEEAAALDILSERDDGPPNYYDYKQFMRALKEVVPRPFTFGPIRFANLNADPSQAKKPAT